MLKQICLTYVVQTLITFLDAIKICIKTCTNIIDSFSQLTFAKVRQTCHPKFGRLSRKPRSKRYKSTHGILVLDESLKCPIHGLRCKLWSMGITEYERVWPQISGSTSSSWTNQLASECYSHLQNWRQNVANSTAFLFAQLFNCRQVLGADQKSYDLNLGWCRSTRNDPEKLKSIGSSVEGHGLSGCTMQMLCRHSGLHFQNFPVDLFPPELQESTLLHKYSQRKSHRFLYITGVPAIRIIRYFPEAKINPTGTSRIFSTPAWPSGSNQWGMRFWLPMAIGSQWNLSLDLTLITLLELRIGRSVQNRVLSSIDFITI